MSRLNFQIEAKASNSKARAARMRTLHNDVLTPIFMPVGTRGTVRTQTNDLLESLGAQVILANTYHLLVRPGMEVFQKFKGLHPFMNWKKSILTDSGGFQIFSLPHARSMGEQGAEFRSYLDGNKFLLTPELSIQMQKAIGSDIMMVLDQCIPSTSTHEQAKDAMELTHRWALRSINERGDSPQSMFAIVQGACFEDLRRQSADVLTNLSGLANQQFDGFAIGGLAVGETKSEREDMTEFTTPLLPENYPRYLMGVGTPIDLLEAVHRGVDMFDCILPTAWAQQGVVFTSHGKIDLKRGVHKSSEMKLDANCDCEACTHYSRAYLHHLTKSKEMLGWQLLSTHNLKFYLDLMSKMRAHIVADTFYDFYKVQRVELAKADEDNPPIAKVHKKRKSSPNTLGDYQIVESRHGFSSIGQISSGEIMHSVSNPNEEAQRIYVDQISLSERKSGLVIWDVGLGAGHNAMALLKAVETQNTPPIRLVSFERDLDPIRLAIQSLKRFSHLKHKAPHLLLAKGRYQTDKIDWILHEGDFLNTFEKVEAPDFVFYDPFSSKVDSPLWSFETFSKLYSHFTQTAEMFTYTNSTAVRSSLLAAGFHVAKGVGTGPKAETTIAVKAVDRIPERDYLKKSWLERRSRSDAKFTRDVSDTLRVQLEEKVNHHPQFI